MGKNLWAVVIILLVLAIGGFLAYKSYISTNLSTTPSPTPFQQATTDSGPTPAESTTEADLSGDVTSTKNVSVTSSEFSPRSITIKVGETVIWINKDNKTHNVSSAPHPQHTNYPALNLGDFIPGKTVKLKFEKAGSYKYHDHLFPSLTGMVVVE